MYFYIMREFLPSLFLFSVVFVPLSLLMLGLFVTWKVCMQIVRVVSLKVHRVRHAASFDPHETHGEPLF
jgi:hypothetical protein